MTHPATPERFGFLDGLRGWGALIVVFYHICSEAFPINGWAHESLNRLLPFNGPMAVLVFFVVSGFSLSVKYLISCDLRGWLQLASGRYVRLTIPILAICLLVHLAMVFGVLEAPQRRTAMFQGMLTFEPTVEHLLSFSLFSVFFDYRIEDTYVGPLWTMGIELYGSAFVLAAILLLRRLAVRHLVLCFLAAALLWSDSSRTQMLALFPIGAAVADTYSRGWLQRISLPAGITLIVIGFAIPLMCRNTVLAWGVFGATSLVVGCIAAQPVRTWLSGRFSAELGRISFPLYLVHGPVMWLVGGPLSRTAESAWAIAALEVFLIVLSLVGAYLFTPANDFAVIVSRRFGRWVVSLTLPKPR